MSSPPFTNAWDETKPADGDLANTLGTQGRQHKLDERQRLDWQHVFGQNVNDDGGHRFVAITAVYHPANTETLKARGYSLTGANAQSMIDLAGTWNTSGVPKAILVNITDTASDPSSALIDLQVGGVSKFKVRKDGVFLSGIPKRNVLTKTANYNMVAGDDLVLASNTITVRLESAVTLGVGAVCDVKNVGTGTITITSNGGTIDGAASQSLPVQYMSLTFISDGTNWFII